MLKASIPVLRVTSSKLAEQHYCGKLGFRKLFEYRPDQTREDPCYMGLQRDDARLDVSSFSGDGVTGSVARLPTSDVDELFEEYRKLGVTIALEPTDQSWGNREMYLRDSDGNCVRFTQDLGKE